MSRRRTTRWTVNRAKAGALLLAVPGAMILAGVSACGNSAPVGPVAASSPSETSPVASTPADAVPSASETPIATPPATPSAGSPAPAEEGTPAAAPACEATDLKVTLTEQPQRREGDSRMALVHLMNTSSRTCNVGGWPVIALVNAADEAVTVPAKNVAEPGKSVPADLVSGGGAFAGMKWTICDKAAPDCPTGNTVKVGLTKGGPLVVATLEGFPNPEQSGLTFKSLQVGTIQPAAQGVVAW
ncbi:DUF4232 domain-containing protein [Planotetraspora kaengkrachanensis]|uniref:DUF4232 domain-containing protein n=1 Tax=Planotetraspora kaengkrachanensis TaxID=575193 RepID=A0A8J3PXU6_9ACTN|nr:DUF4232 domain-containing protein [Planotetraspora kaengkrachanensis]GIG83085.1 hypothetical protein Pka01_62120 [Planotetraspora kaengkrachanensis]